MEIYLSTKSKNPRAAHRFYLSALDLGLLMEGELPAARSMGVAAADEGMVGLAVLAGRGALVADHDRIVGELGQPLLRHLDVLPAAFLRGLGDVLALHLGGHFGEDHEAFVVGVLAVGIGTAGPEFGLDGQQAFLE